MEGTSPRSPALREDPAGQGAEPVHEGNGLRRQPQRNSVQSQHDGAGGPRARMLRAGRSTEMQASLQAPPSSRPLGRAPPPQANCALSGSGLKVLRASSCPCSPRPTDRGRHVGKISAGASSPPGLSPAALSWEQDPYFGI